MPTSFIKMPGNPKPAVNESAIDVKALLMPLTSLESFFEKLIEWLPRKRIKVKLLALSDIEIVSEQKGEFKSTGHAPTFSMELGGAIKAGWYYLEAALARNNGSRVASIVANFDNENKKILIPSILRGSIREVVYLPLGVKELRWLPTEASGFFTQSPILLHHISWIESFVRRFHRVIFDLFRFRHIPPNSRAGLNWPSLLIDIQTAYEASAKLRIQNLNGSDYSTYIIRYDTLTASAIRKIRRKIEALKRKPFFSVILPLKEASFSQIVLTLGSIRQQLYEYWELLIVVSSNTNTSVVDEIRNKVGNDPRVKIVFCEFDESSSFETADLLNCGLASAQGDWFIYITQNDCLPQHALYYFACESVCHPEALLIYGDDDEIEIDGGRTAPRFKPDWNADLLLSHDYIGNPVAFLRSKLLELGGFANGFQGAESYELSLRYLKGISEYRVRHIPKVLYHRFAPQLYGENLFVKHNAVRSALQRHFNGSGVVVEDGMAPSLYRIKYPLPEVLPLVSIIVPTRDKVGLLRACIESVQRITQYSAWELLIVDNGSVEPETKNYFEELKEDSRIKVLRYDAPFNYSAINNYAVTHAQGEILVLLNNDVEVISEDWLSEMVSHAIRPEIGAVGAKLLYPDGTIQHAGVILGIGGVAGHIHRFLPGDAPGYCNRAVLTQNLSAITGACLVVRKKLYQEIGGLNEDDLHVAFNDIDFCLRLLVEGYKNLFTPFALLYHHESVSRGLDDTPEKKAIFNREYNYMKGTWGDKLDYDFAYNINLNCRSDNFSIKF